MNAPECLVIERPPARVLTEMDREFLDSSGTAVPKPASYYRKYRQDFRIAWANLRLLHTLPTTELIEWLQRHVIDRYGADNVIEIGAGRSGIGKALSIRQTDSYLCLNPTALLMYSRFGTVPPIPPACVERLEANEAVAKYRPKAVIASWVSQKVEQDDRNPPPGSIFGVDKDKLIDSVEQYVQIGNCATHGTDRVMRIAHETIRRPWLLSRSQYPEKNAIYVWTRADPLNT